MAVFFMLTDTTASQVMMQRLLSRTITYLYFDDSIALLREVTNVSFVRLVMSVS